MRVTAHIHQIDQFRIVIYGCDEVLGEGRRITPGSYVRMLL
jgi:hypothetical protein